MPLPAPRSRPGTSIARLFAVALVAIALVAACSTGSTPAASGNPSGSASASASGGAASDGTGSAGAGSRMALTVGLGYIPSVQFAQFYLAQQRGYYRDAGLAVTFENKIDPDLIRLTGQGAVDVSLADGTSLIPAISQGIPVRYIATIYAKFPNIVFAKASSGIRTAADLKGRKVGTPGRFGSGWIGLEALLQSAGLTTNDIDVVEYPDFGQLAGVQQGAVAAATGFANNEPIQLQRSGTPVVVLHVDPFVALPGNGLIAGEATIASKGEALRALVAVTLRAMKDIIADPAAGLDATIAAVPELGSDRAGQLAVLEATIDTWQSDVTAKRGLGAIDIAGWQASIDFMKKLPGDLVPNPVTVDRAVTSDLLPKS
ncbi:MAG TPA: ABC transporter substrate-binding protein [Candidatus Dormibacteraeota bacterium]|nr:ABC transporter substrate-binding protein [Candidatus Dormibacteraeota bacterium]